MVVGRWGGDVRAKLKREDEQQTQNVEVAKKWKNACIRKRAWWRRREQWRMAYGGGVWWCWALVARRGKQRRRGGGGSGADIGRNQVAKIKT